MYATDPVQRLRLLRQRPALLDDLALPPRAGVASSPSCATPTPATSARPAWTARRPCCRSSSSRSARRPTCATSCPRWPPTPSLDRRRRLRARRRAASGGTPCRSTGPSTATPSRRPADVPTAGGPGPLEIAHAAGAPVRPAARRALGRRRLPRPRRRRARGPHRLAGGQPAAGPDRRRRAAVGLAGLRHRPGGGDDPAGEEAAVRPDACGWPTTAGGDAGGPRAARGRGAAADAGRLARRPTSRTRGGQGGPDAVGPASATCGSGASTSPTTSAFVDEVVRLLGCCRNAA